MGKQILLAWSKFHCREEYDNSIFCNVPLWGNSCTRRASKPFLLRKLIDSNINIIANIYDIDSKTFSRMKDSWKIMVK